MELVIGGKKILIDIPYNTTTGAMGQNRNYWDDSLKIALQGRFFDNLTDFSDSTCFTYFVASTDCPFCIGGQELRNYLADGGIAYYVKLQISFRAPVMYAVFCKYHQSGTSFHMSEQPYTQEQEKIFIALTQFAQSNNLTVMRYSALCEEKVFDTERTAFNYLFEPEM